MLWLRRLMSLCLHITRLEYNVYSVQLILYKDVDVHFASLFWVWRRDCVNHVILLDVLLPGTFSSNICPHRYARYQYLQHLIFTMTLTRSLIITFLSKATSLANRGPRRTIPNSLPSQPQFILGEEQPTLLHIPITSTFPKQVKLRITAHSSCINKYLLPASQTFFSKILISTTECFFQVTREL